MVTASPGLRLGAGFYADPGGRADAAATKAEERAARALKRAEALRAGAEAERAAAEKAGIRALTVDLSPIRNGGTPDGPWEGD